MKRMQMLAFQRKLLISSLSLPRNDAMALLKIVRENLDEFIETRLYDENQDKMDHLMEETFGVYNLWAMTVLKRFPFISTMEMETTSDIETLKIQTNTIKTPTKPRTNMMHFYHVDLENLVEPVNTQWCRCVVIYHEPDLKTLCSFKRDRRDTGYVQYAIIFKYEQLAHFSKLVDVNATELSTETHYAARYNTAVAAKQDVGVGSETSNEAIYRFPFDINRKPANLPLLLRTKYNVFPAQVDEAWITVYRTDPSPDIVDEGYYQFFLDLAMGCKAHFFIELRARGEASNNMRLATELMRVGADVCVIPQHPDYFNKKVHGKMMIFRCGMRYLQVYSTGNFSTNAGYSFRDTVLVRNWTNDPPMEMLKMMRSIMVGPAFDAPDHLNIDFLWRPGEIRLLIQGICKGLMNTITMGGDAITKPFIYIKCNGLTDPGVCRALIDAANMGVVVRIICRSTCELPFFMEHENIQIYTLCGKYLEHDRFLIAGDELALASGSRDVRISDAYIMSADLMPRNLDNRIEFAVRIKDKHTYIELFYLFERLMKFETSPKEGLYRFPMTYAMGEAMFDDDDDTADEKPPESE